MGKKIRVVFIGIEITVQFRMNFDFELIKHRGTKTFR